MSNMSYCRHENTASDLSEVLDYWDDWARDNDGEDPNNYESRGRKRIIMYAISLVQALQEEDLLDEDLNLTDDEAHLKEIGVDSYL